MEKYNDVPAKKDRKRTKDYEKKSQTATWDAAQYQKNGYEHFMLKEIYEQPTAIRETIDAKWVTAEEILQLMEADKFVPIGENQYHKELLGVDTNF